MHLLGYTFKFNVISASVILDRVYIPPAALNDVERVDCVKLLEAFFQIRFVLMNPLDKF